MPLWVYFELVACVCAVSTAAVVFRSMEDVPPLLLSSWRLQLNALLLVPPLVREWRGLSSDVKAQCVRALPLTLTSGACLAVHFGSWVTSIKLTSLPHSLLFVSTTPLFLVAWTLLRCQHISTGEVVGSVCGFAGSVVLTVDYDQHSGVTLIGDLTAMCGALAMAAYMLIGSKLRSWMPLFVYAFPVNFTAAVYLSVASLLVEGTSLADIGSNAVFGYVGVPTLLLKVRPHNQKKYTLLCLCDSQAWIFLFLLLPTPAQVCYLAVGPGIVGHLVRSPCYAYT